MTWHTFCAIIGYMPEPDDTISRLRAERETILEQAEQIRRKILTEVRNAFPAEGEAPRGMLTRMVNATGWTRAYVADIRDGKVKAD